MRLVVLSRWLWGAEPEYTAVEAGAGLGSTRLGIREFDSGSGGEGHSELSLQTDLPSP